MGVGAGNYLLFEISEYIQYLLASNTCFLALAVAEYMNTYKKISFFFYTGEKPFS